MTNRDIGRASLIVVVALLLGLGLLYAYRAQSPDGPSPIGGVMAAVFAIVPLVFFVALILLAARAMARSSAGDRYDALARVADLRDRGVLSEDEFQREKRRILG